MSEQSLNSKLIAWYISRSGETSGPFATEMVVAMLRDGRLASLDLVFREGDLEWRPAVSFSELKSGARGSDAASDRLSERSDRSRTTEAPIAVSAESSIGARSKNEKSDPMLWIVLKPHRGTYLQEGPIDTQTIIDGLATGRFQFSQYAWHVGMSQWMRIGDLREFDRRARSRDSKPHVPPPLPDPIEAVLLEDDKDQNAEEFHVAMKGASKFDLTPGPLEALGNVGIGGAAADSPEEKTAQAKAGQAMAIVVSPNLAGVPWEQDFAERYAVQSSELIDDEFSGIELEKRFDESVSFVTNPGALRSTAAPVQPPQHDENQRSQNHLETTVRPFVPSPPVDVPKDHWALWGRYVAGATLATLLVIFLVHLATDKSVDDFNRTKAVAAEVSPAPAPVPVKKDAALADPFLDETLASGPDVTAGNLKRTAGKLSILALKLDKPDAQIVVQGPLSQGTPVEVSFRGRLGQVLSKLNIRKSLEVQARSGELPTIRLRDLKLPDGSYTVEVKAGEAQARTEIFVGRRNASFLDRLETHLREVSQETQSQKKALFYSAQELDLLARDLGQNYGQLRGQAERWLSFFSGWTKKVDTVGRTLAQLEKKNVDDQAYPEETAALKQAFERLKKLAGQYEEAIGQKRDLASDELTELISELSRQKTVIGDATARPMTSGGTL